MSHSDTNFPNWFFRLDELDLLELQYEALYDERDAAEPFRRAIEEKVLAEQEAWEEKTQEELERLLGDTELEGECPFHHHDEEATIDELLYSSIGEDPLAAEAYAYTRWLADWASRQKATMRHFEDIFRLRANAPLIPAKLAFAAAEESYEDGASLLIAEKEADAAGTYLSWMLSSVAALSKEEVMTQAESSAFLDQGERLLGRIVGKRDHLRAALKFRRL